MSVLIKGMAMPKSCKECKLSYVDESGGYFGGTEVRCVLDGERIAHDGRWDDCPLVEVPTPHGRLIEEPKELSYFGLAYISRYDAPEIAEYFSKQIKNQPTVIEAEEGFNIEANDRMIERIKCLFNQHKLKLCEDKIYTDTDGNVHFTYVCERCGKVKTCIVGKETVDYLLEPIEEDDQIVKEIREREEEQRVNSLEKALNDLKQR